MVFYLDAAGEIQKITLALVVENSVQKTTWIPFAAEILQFVDQPHLAQETFAAFTGGLLKPGRFIDVAFGMPTEVTSAGGLQSKQVTLHHGELIESIYTEAQIEDFAISGNAYALENLIVPLAVTQIEKIYGQ